MIQTQQVFADLGRALAAAGALPKDVAKITIYVVDYQLDLHYPIIDGLGWRYAGDHKLTSNVVLGGNRCRLDI